MATNLADLAGAVDGANKQFTTPTPYARGSVVVRVDAANLPGGEVTELDPNLGVVELENAPVIGSILVAAYADPVPLEKAVAVTAFVEQIERLSTSGGNDLSFVAGESGDLLRVTVYDAKGNRVDLDDYDLLFSARRGSESGTLVWSKLSYVPVGGGPAEIVFEDQGTTEGLGRARIAFTDVETQAESAQILVWDLWARTPADELVSLVQGGIIEVRAAVRVTFPAAP